MKDCCIIIPIYNVTPTATEVLSIKRNCTVLKDYDIYFIHPFFMNISAYEQLITEIFMEHIKTSDKSVKDTFNNNTHFFAFKKKYFKSNKTYSRLLLSEDFYRQFIKYEYMLIAQTDTYILNTEHSLKEFIDTASAKNYSYIGAPWPDGPFCKPYSLKDYVKLMVIKEPSNIHVGNGGFSLRHVVNCINLIRKNQALLTFGWRFNEDMFFSYLGSKEGSEYRVADTVTAGNFALETNMREEIEKGHIPYAVHAFEKYYSTDELTSLTP